MFEYEVVPVLMTRGAAGSVAEEEWTAVREGLNERGRQGFRVVAVSDGAEGRAIIMERPLGDSVAQIRAEAATAASVTDAAEEITRESAAHRPQAE
jgi:hypothetical protein